MTTKNIKNQTTPLLMATAFAVIISTISLTPAFADWPPYLPDDGWFNYNGDPDMCYLTSELNSMTVDDSTGNGE